MAKAHSNFESKLAAQEERVKIFSENADKLIQINHARANEIDIRRTEVLSNRQNVYTGAKRRRLRLEQALIFENLRRDANELSAWIVDKKRIASDESYKSDQVALDRKLLKHEAFVAELNFNATQLDRINKVYIYLNNFIFIYFFRKESY